jgi:hypothetical protein
MAASVASIFNLIPDQKRTRLEAKSGITGAKQQRLVQMKSPALPGFCIRDRQATIKVERLMMGRRRDKRLCILAMLLHMFGHPFFLRRHHRLLFHVSIPAGVM